jgi:hypothetical protein
VSFPDDSEFNRWAEQQFLREYPDAVRAPPGSPYDFAVGPFQIEVKGIAYTTHEGSKTRRGRVFISLEHHRDLGPLPRPMYVIYIYNGETKRVVKTWGQIDKLIRRYKTFTRNSRPKGMECVKLGFRRLMGEK